MKETEFLPEMKGIFPRSREQDHLEAVIDEIQKKRGGKHEIKDIARFKSRLLTLANIYRTMRQKQEELESARKRFAEISHLASALNAALSLLTDVERKQLIAAQGSLLCDFDGLDEYEYLKRDDLFGSGYELRDSFWAIEDLKFLSDGAQSLSKKKERGRQSDRVERHVAQQFVVLCHEHGWSSIGVANSGVENKSSAFQSDAVRCLSAVLLAGGCREQSKALTTLKAIRKHGFVHFRGSTYIDSFGREVLDEEFGTFYYVDLTKFCPEESRFLPDFIPKD